MDTSTLLPMLNMVVMMAMTDRASSSQMALTVVAMLLPQALPALVAWLKEWWAGVAGTYAVSVNSRMTPDVFRAVSRMVRLHITRCTNSMVVGTALKFSGVDRALLQCSMGSRFMHVPVTCPTGRFQCTWKGVAIDGELEVQEREKATVVDVRLSVRAAHRATLDAFVEAASREAWEEENVKKGAGPSSQVAFSLRVDQERVSWRATFLSVSKTFDTLWLAPALQAAIIGDLDTFMASADFYRQRGMPHKRGMLFHGPPGTGKTSCIYAIADKLHYAVYRMSVRQCTPEQLRRALHKVKDAAVIVVEEVDLELARETYGQDVKAGDAEPTDKSKLSVLMEYLDGYLTHSPGTLVIFTTNHKEDIPPPLIRPGRIDRHFLFPPLSGADVTRVARQFTGILDLECPDVTIPAADLINAVLLPHIGDEEALRVAVAALRDGEKVQ